VELLLLSPQSGRSWQTSLVPGWFVMRCLILLAMLAWVPLASAFFLPFASRPCSPGAVHTTTVQRGSPSATVSLRGVRRRCGDRIATSLGRVSMQEEDQGDEQEGDCRVFVDMECGGEPAGRMVFNIGPGVACLPKTAESFRQQITGERTSVEPLLSYKGCEFEYNPTYVVGGSYKFSHICKGRGRNIYGRKPFVEREAFGTCRNPCPGAGGGGGTTTA